MMRLIIDSLMALMLAGLLAGIMAHQRSDELAARNEQELRANVRLIQQQIVVQAALERVPRNSAGFPTTIDPEWFGADMPTNPLFAGRSNPWLEIASPAEANLTQPEARACMNDKTATFWYNPANGIIRARVPYMASDASTLAVYNFVNGTDLASLFSDQLDPSSSVDAGSDATGGAMHSPIVENSGSRSLTATGNDEAAGTLLASSRH